MTGLPSVGLTYRTIDLLPINVLVPQYLMCSYCYYQQDESPITDDAFDYLCKRLDREYEQITHRHKKLVKRGALQAGTCFLRASQYPPQVRYGWAEYLAFAVSGRLESALLHEHDRKVKPKVTKRTRNGKPTVKVIKRRSRVK